LPELDLRFNVVDAPRTGLTMRGRDPRGPGEGPRAIEEALVRSESYERPERVAMNTDAESRKARNHWWFIEAVVGGGGATGELASQEPGAQRYAPSAGVGDLAFGAFLRSGPGKCEGRRFR
jgi:hypothetical protein